jgi:drug/metabolite transporter (DMT)-like permease
MLLWLLVAARIIANPVSNVFQKQLTQRGADAVFVIAATHLLLAIACVPALVWPLELKDAGAFWGNILVAVVLAVAGNALLVAALRTSDLSVLGPINAYKSVIGLVLGVFLVGELPTRLGVLGVLLILAGSYFVVDRDPNQPRRNAFVQFFRERGVQLRFAALGLSATEAVFLKRALLASSPGTAFVCWCVLGLPIAALATWLLLRSRVREQITIAQQNRGTYLWLALTTGVMQCTTLFTFGKLQVGYSLALFQLSTLLSVLLGYRYFQEQNIRKRLIGSLIMVAGAALIVVFGART